MTQALHIVPDGSRDSGRCACCGRFSRTVRGHAWWESERLAAYFVHWSRGHVAERGANIDLVIGEWGEGTTAEDRVAVSLEYRVLESGPAVMVIDADAEEIAEAGLAGWALGRHEVIGNPLAREVFALYDAIIAQDTRLEEILCGWTVGG